jgi:hypothetical protein
MPRVKASAAVYTPIQPIEMPEKRFSHVHMILQDLYLSHVRDPDISSQ